MTATVADWPDRVEESILLPHDDQTLQLINTFEEYLYEDSSATEWTGGVMLDHRTDTELPEGVCSYGMRYDGISDREFVFASWQRLVERAIPRDMLEWIRQQPSADQAFREHMRRRREFGGMVGRRQREAAQRRQEEQEQQQQEQFRIQWHDTERWHTPDGSYVIGEMDDPFLWHTVIWLVRNQVRLQFLYGETLPHVTPALAAAMWLRSQPTFRAMLKESIRRNFTFPGDVFNYCKRYVLDGNNTLDGYQPWNDPGQSEQPKELAGMLDLPDVPPELELNKDLRAITL
jgi:hypothetical protein